MTVQAAATYLDIRCPFCDRKFLRIERLPFPVHICFRCIRRSCGRQVELCIADGDIAIV